MSFKSGGICFREFTASLQNFHQLFGVRVDDTEGHIRWLLCRRNNLGLSSGIKGGLVLGEELANGLGELSSLAGPVVDAIALEVNGGGLGAGVVGTDNFDRTAVAGAIFFDDNDAIMGLLTGANARQTNHQHRGRSSQKSLNVFRVVDGVRG